MLRATDLQFQYVITDYSFKLQLIYSTIKTGTQFLSLLYPVLRNIICAEVMSVF